MNTHTKPTVKAHLQLSKLVGKIISVIVYVFPLGESSHALKQYLSMSSLDLPAVLYPRYSP